MTMTMADLRSAPVDDGAVSPGAEQPRRRSFTAECERTSVSGKKSHHVDAMALANFLRTDQRLHRMLPDDSDLARSITVLARAYQDAVWRRTKLVQELCARLQCPAPVAATSSSGCTRPSCPGARQAGEPGPARHRPLQTIMRC